MHLFAPHYRVLTAAALTVTLCFRLTPFLNSQQAAPTASIGQAPVRIVPPPPNYRFPAFQAYVYTAEWHLITAGTAVVRMETACSERKVVATAESQGAVNVIFPVHDRFEAKVDPRKFCSNSIFKHSEEGPHKRETSIHFDYARKKIVLDEKNLKTGETKKVENDLDNCATDVITGFYYLQSMPLQLGSVYEFPINDGKTTMVRATVEKREQIKVPVEHSRLCWSAPKSDVRPAPVKRQGVGVVFGRRQPHTRSNARQTRLGNVVVPFAADRKVATASQS